MQTTRDARPTVDACFERKKIPRSTCSNEVFIDESLKVESGKDKHRGTDRKHFVGDSYKCVRRGADEVAAIPPSPTNERPRHTLERGRPKRWTMGLGLATGYEWDGNYLWNGWTYPG